MLKDKNAIYTMYMSLSLYSNEMSYIKKKKKKKN